MFRTKITLTFVILTSLLLGGVYLIMHGSIVSGFEQSAETALRRGATVEEQAIRLDEFALAEKAAFTASNGNLHRTMLLDEDPELYARLQEKYPQASNSTELRHLAVYDEPLTVDKIRLKDVEANTKDQRNLDLDLYERRPALPELFLIVDKSGKGVAALGKDNYKWFGDNVAKKYPVVLKAVEQNRPVTAVWSWSWTDSDNVDLYRVAIVPIRPSRGEKPSGVVITGSPIDDGSATRAQRLMTGITSEGDDLDTVDRATFEAAPDVAFFRGEKIVGSTFSGTREDHLKTAIFDTTNILETDRPEELLELEVDGESYVGIVRYFSGEFRENKPPTGYVVLGSLDEAAKPAVRAMNNIFLMGGGVLLLGVILLMFFIHKFLKPTETLEQGIGEVLAGNKDYTFELHDAHPVFHSIAQGLNLMSAFLQGKPMPDDVEEMDGWGELIGDGGEPTGGGGKSQVQGVQMPGMGGSKKKQDDDSDSSS